MIEHAAGWNAAPARRWHGRAFFSGGAVAAFVEWQRDIAAFVALDKLMPPPASAVLFVGSSAIRLWHTMAADFPQVATIKRGFGGSRIADSVYFVETLHRAHQPAGIVLYAGGNDLAAGNLPGRCATMSRRSCGRRAAGQADTACLPVDQTEPVAACAIALSANALICRCAAVLGVDYLDVHTSMLSPDGQAEPRWLNHDGLHPNAGGYAP